MATSLGAFKTYQETDAWTWEHLALTRARPVAGSAEIGSEVEAFRAALLGRARETGDVLRDVAEMRARLAAARAGSPWDAKSGRGRLQDIALLAQAGALLAGATVRDVAGQIAAGAGALGLGDADVERLSRAQTLFWHMQAAQRLMTADAFDPGAVGQGGRMFLLRETGAEDMAALEKTAARVAGEAGDVIDHVLRGSGEDHDGGKG